MSHGWVELVGCEPPLDEAYNAPGAKSVGTPDRPSYRGINYEALGQSLGYSNIKTSDFSHQQDTPAFQGDLAFYDVRYPYWQFPFNTGPYNQNVIKIFGAGTYEHQSNLGIVGRPRGIDDWNTPLSTPYGVPPDEL